MALDGRLQRCTKTPPSMSPRQLNVGPPISVFEQRSEHLPDVSFNHSIMAESSFNQPRVWQMFPKKNPTFLIFRPLWPACHVHAGGEGVHLFAPSPLEDLFRRPSTLLILNGQRSNRQVTVKREKLCCRESRIKPGG
eukprot:s5357_g2.t1